MLIFDTLSGDIYVAGAITEKVQIPKVDSLNAHYVSQAESGDWKNNNNTSTVLKPSLPSVV